MKYFIVLFFGLLFLNCDIDISGTYEILERTDYEKRIVKENIDSLKYYRKNIGSYFLTLKKDNTFYLRDINNENVDYFKGKWKVKNKKLFIYYKSEDNEVEKVFQINKNTLLNIEKIMLCDSSKYVNNVIFLTKTKNPE